MNTPAEALAFAKDRAASGLAYPVGNCLGFTRDAFGSSATGGSAASAFALTAYRHTDQAPAGFPLWWTGGSEGFGHVAISDGSGYCYSTDFGQDRYYGDGRVRRIPVVNVAAQSNPAKPLIYKAWSEDLDGVEVLGMTDAQMQELKNFIDARVEMAVAALGWGRTVAGAPWANSDSWVNQIAADNIMALLNKATTQASSGGIDYAALAKAVNDDAAKRLQA